VKIDDVPECFIKDACVIVYSGNGERIGDLRTVSAFFSNL